MVPTPTLWIPLQWLLGTCAVTLSHAELAHNKSTTGIKPLPRANASPKDRDDQPNLECIAKEKKRRG